MRTLEQADPRTKLGQIPGVMTNTRFREPRECRMTKATDEGNRATVVSRDGTRIDYEQWGNGPALVLVHGGLVDRSFWGPSLPLLAQHYTVYALDRRGHGHSGPYPADHDIEREYEDVAAMVAAVGGPAGVLGPAGVARGALRAARRAHAVPRLGVHTPPRF